MKNHSIGVSVIITTKNEEPNIRNCLESINKQDYPQDQIEIIIVDNHSTDGTLSVAKNFTDKIYTHGPERSSQRNFGVNHSAGKYVLYLDADMILSSNVIKECVASCDDSDYIALYIPEKVIGNGFWIKVRDFERSFYNRTCIDCVRFLRKDKFIEIGGFNEDLTGPEDWDFDRRINAIGHTGIIAAPIYHNEGDFNLMKYTGKKAYYAGSFKKYAEIWGKNDPIIKKQLGFWYRYFGVFWEDGKWIRLLTNPVLAMAMYFLRFSVGAAYLIRKRAG